MENFYLDYRGFDPTEFYRMYLKSRLEELHAEAPYGSNFSAVISRKDKLFKGVITIYSSAGKFIVVARDENLKILAHKLAEQTRRQLGKWKSRRFRGESAAKFFASYKPEEPVYDKSGTA